MHYNFKDLDYHQHRHHHYLAMIPKIIKVLKFTQFHRHQPQVYHRFHQIAHKLNWHTNNQLHRKIVRVATVHRTPHAVTPPLVHANQFTHR